MNPRSLGFPIPAMALVSLLLAVPAFAQTTTPTGARPGNVIGTGSSLPLGNTASNINQADTKSTIAPNLPSPDLGPDAGPAAYLKAARTALKAGHTGEAQQAMEMATTRALDRTVSYGNPDKPSDNPLISKIRTALHALGAGKRQDALQDIDAALQIAQQ